MTHPRETHAACHGSHEHGSARPPAPTTPPPSGSGEWTCPMHPEVRSSGPGTCPKCGMALEPRSAAVATENPELRDMSRRFWVSVALTLPVLLLGMAELLP